MKVSVCEKCRKKVYSDSIYPTLYCEHTLLKGPNVNNSLAVPSPCPYRNIPAGTEYFTRDIWEDSTHLSFYTQVECDTITNMMNSLKDSDKDFGGCETFLDSGYTADSVDEFIKEAGTF